MREIKFRAYCKSKGMFQIDVLALTEGPWSSEGRNGVSIPFQPSVSVMQCTGVKDFNGYEIYEGDILHGGYGIPPRGITAAVEFENGAFIVKTPGHNPDQVTVSEAIEYLQMEIHGNIYEDPELLR